MTDLNKVEVSKKRNTRTDSFSLDIPVYNWLRKKTKRGNKSKYVNDILTIAMKAEVVALEE